MRLGFIADIHGNLAALEEVVAWLERHPPDQVIVLGDIINGAADSKACYELVKAKGYTLLRGNHERYIFDFDTPRAEPTWSSEYFLPARWTFEQFNLAERQALATLASSMFLAADPKVFLAHASALGDRDNLSLYTSDTEVSRLFPQDCELIVRAHNHVAFERYLPQTSKTRLVSLGSAGLPLSGKVQAEFATAEKFHDGWHVHHHALKYDVEKTLERFKTSGLLEAGGIIGRLFMREIATGSYQVVPFLTFHQKYGQGKSLEKSLAEFLNRY